MSEPNWMIYGANGYTGDLIAREAKKRKMNPVLAGRNEGQVRKLAEELALTWRVFPLDDVSAVAAHLEDMEIVLHCAGPFSATSAPMIEGCLASRAHYLDITGEIDVFEAAQMRHTEAGRAGVVLCPGVGFDVIPTDCVAACLAEALPGATRLALAFDSRSQLSRGTAKTSIEGIGKGGKIRRGGKILTVPFGGPFRRIDFGHGEKEAVRIPWGDVATAYHTTGIPDIEVFMGILPEMKGQLRMLRWLRPFFALKSIQGFAKRHVDRSVVGPAESERIVYGTLVWGEASDANGLSKTARLATANGYAVTVDGSLAVVAHLLENQVAPGTYTPATLMGARFAESLPGSSKIEIH